jgi:hypothetical protein
LLGLQAGENPPCARTPRPRREELAREGSRVRKAADFHGAISFVLFRQCSHDPDESLVDLSEVMPARRGHALKRVSDDSCT